MDPMVLPLAVTTTLDIAALVNAILWPLIILIVVLLYRAHLLELFQRLSTNVKSFSLAGVKVELAEASRLAMPAPTADAAVDLRHAGQSADVNDSTVWTFYEQIRQGSRLDYAVIDLGDGTDWLASRVYILSAILRRMRGLQALVFLGTVGEVRRRFLGSCECERIRWKLGARYPWLEAALTLAEARVWAPASGALPINQPAGLQLSGSIRPLRIANGDGRILDDNASPQPAADLLKLFLDGVQFPGPPPAPDWEALPARPGQPPLSEHAPWLSERLLEDVLGDALQLSSVRLRDLQGKSEMEKGRLLLDQPSRWIAVLREDGAFDLLLDRHPTAEAIARRAMMT